MTTSSSSLLPIIVKDEDLILPNSFVNKINDWQNIPDIQDFYEKDWLEGESRVKINPSFGNGETRVNADITVTPSFQVIDSVDLIHKFNRFSPAQTKTLGVTLNEDQLKFQYDTGFRRSWKYNFNPYYKLAFNRNFGFNFRKLGIGLNFAEKDNITHHELTLMQDDEELKLRFRNSYMMTWRILKYCVIGSLTYGKKIESTNSQLVSIHPHKNFLGYLMINNLANDETNYNAGAKVEFSQNFSAYLNIHVNPYKHYSWMLGSRFDTGKGVAGKVILKELNEVSLHLTTESLIKGKCSLLATVPIGKDKVQSPTWGVNVTVDF